MYKVHHDVLKLNKRKFKIITCTLVKDRELIIIMHYKQQKQSDILNKSTAIIIIIIIVQDKVVVKVNVFD